MKWNSSPPVLLGIISRKKLGISTIFMHFWAHLLSFFLHKGDSSLATPLYVGGIFLPKTNSLAVAPASTLVY